MLNWETILDTTVGDDNKSNHLAVEPNNKLYQYHRDGDFAKDRFTQIELGDYRNPLWGSDEQHLTNQKVRRIGIKHFPQIGAIGFWTLLNEERSKILAPIHHEVVKYASPIFTMEETSDTFIFHMDSPEDLGSHLSPSVLNAIGVVGDDVKYKCFRVVLRLDKFAMEYVSYEKTLEVPKPPTTGTYDIYCIGYIHEGEAVSEDSTHYMVYVDGIQETWPGPDSGADLFVTDIEVVEGNKIQMTRSDGFKKQSETSIPDIHPVSATFLSDGRLAITLNTGDVLVTDNTAPGEQVDPVTLVGSSTAEVTSGTTLTVNVGTAKDLLALCVVVHRSDITTVTEGWNLVASVEAAEIATDGALQRLSIYYKYAEGTSEVFSVTQATAGRIYINAHTFRNAGVPELYIPQKIYSKSGDVSNPMVLNKQSYDTVLWCAHMYLYTASPPYPLWTMEPEGPTLIQLGSTTPSRLLTAVDGGLPQDYTLYNASNEPAAVLGIRIPIGDASQKDYVTREELEEAIKAAINDSWEAEY